MLVIGRDLIPNMHAAIGHFTYVHSKWQLDFTNTKPRSEK